MALPRQFPKGFREVLFPSDNITLLFTSKDFSGEITLDNETGDWIFNPPLNLSSSPITGLDTYIDSRITTYGAITDAPSDGKQYARQNAEWSEVVTGGGALEAPISTTITVGGITSGTTLAIGTELEQIFRSMLTPYQTSVLSTFSISLSPIASIYEVGQTVTIGNAIFTYTNDSNGIPPHDFVVTGAGFTGTYQASPVSSDGSTSQYTTVSTKSWTLAALNANNVATNTLSFSRSSQWRMFYGALSSFLIASLQQSKLNANQSTTWTSTADNQNPSNYTYIAYSSVYPDLTSIVLNGAAPVLGAFTKQSDVSYTNPYGITQTYKVYKSNATGAFASGDTLTIS